jgi:formylglycine-generating enzyme required for sulfatase activity
MTLNRRNLFLALVGVLSVLLMMPVSLQVYAAVTERLPISESQIRLAQEGVRQNKDWQPVIRRFDKLDWALVPAGCFNMGSTESQLEEALGACKVYGGGDCKYVFDLATQPGSPVCFEKPYWIGLTEVTNREYGSSSSTDMVMMYRGSKWPRETVTWQAAFDFCTNVGSRLPTEAEWEYAASGPDELIYAWGNEVSSIYQKQAGRLNPQDVDSIQADTAWIGALGMSGNVMEWVMDRNSEQPIARGGSWASYAPFLLRTTQRIPYNTEYASSVIGFRCVRDFVANR